MTYDLDTSKKMLLKSLEKRDFHISDACRDAKVTRQTYYTWREVDKEFDAECEAIEQRLVDDGERKLRELVNGAMYETALPDGRIIQLRDKPNPTAVIFLLKTKGKKRGYIERQEIDHQGRIQIIDSHDI